MKQTVAIPIDAPIEVAGRPGGASLDILRFVAAGFVVLFHYSNSAPVTLDHWPSVFQQGWLATNFFLMLSGYILSRAYGRRVADGQVRPTQFILKRFARLWPSHLIVLLFFGAFVMLSSDIGVAPGHADRYSPLAFFAQAFLVHGWGMFHTPGWNIPTWTLSDLMICYAIFTLYIPLVYRRAPWVLAAIAATVLLLGHIVAMAFAHQAFVDLSFQFALLRAIPLFIIGTLVERLAGSLRVSRQVFATTIILCLVSVVFLTGLPRNALTDTVILAASATVLAVSGAVTFAENELTQRLGRASFALFLVHSVVGAIWFGISAKIEQRFGFSGLGSWALWLVGVVMAVNTAIGFDAVIDRPLSQWISRLGFIRGTSRQAD